MRSRTLIAGGAATLALGLLLTGCTGPRAVSPSTPPRVTTLPSGMAPIEDGRTLVASRVNEFYNHFLAYEPTVRQRVGSVLRNVKPADLTEAEARRINTAVEQADPYFAQFYTRGMKASAITAFYQTWLTKITPLQGKTLTIAVAADQVRVSGDRASVKEVQVLRNGQPVSGQDSDIEDSILAQQLTRYNGQWLFNPQR